MRFSRPTLVHTRTRLGRNDATDGGSAVRRRGPDEAADGHGGRPARLERGGSHRIDVGASGHREDAPADRGRRQRGCTLGRTPDRARDCRWHRGSAPAVQLLLEYGASPFPAKAGDPVPLQLAARIGNADVFRLLLDYGADPAGIGARFLRTSCLRAPCSLASTVMGRSPGRRRRTAGCARPSSHHSAVPLPWAPPRRPPPPFAPPSSGACHCSRASQSRSSPRPVVCPVITTARSRRRC